MGEDEALTYARELEQQILRQGAVPAVPVDVKNHAQAYVQLVERTRQVGGTPEQAVDYYIKWMGEQVVRSAKPFINDLVDSWYNFKKLDQTLSKKTTNELEQYGRFIKRNWGTSKPDDIKRNDIDTTLKKLDVSNNTRRKHLTYIRMFFGWVKDEGYLLINPSDGIKFKADGFEARFYTPEKTKQIIEYVSKNQPDLIGYYTLLTFAGLRPTEGARVQWDDINFKTGELYVRKGKTQARHVKLEPVALKWLELHKQKCPTKFVELKALPNREKLVRESVGDWIQDGLRHGFATYYKNLKKDINLTAEMMGNSPNIIKKHYARTIEQEKIDEFWNLSPEKLS